MFEYSKMKRELLRKAEEEMMDMRHPYVGTEHLLLSLLSNKSISNLTSSYNLTYDNFKRVLLDIVGSADKASEVILYTPLMRSVIGKSKDDVFNILYTLLSSDDGIALRILEIMGIEIDELTAECMNYDETVIMEEFEYVKGKDILVGREKEISNILEILLRRNKNNPLLIGEAGVGKSAIVYELARRIEEESVPDKLLGYKIINVDMSSMLSNTKYRGEFETKINNLIKKVKNKKVLLFIDEIHMIVKSGGGESSIDAANILKPYLANREITIIGATTTQEYEEFIAPDKALARRFATVNILEPDTEETKNILKKIKSVYEEYHGYHLSEKIIDKIVEFSNLYMKNRSNPDKSIEIMDVILSRAHIKSKELEYVKSKDFESALKLRNVKSSDVDDVIESLTGIHILKNSDYQKTIKELNNIVETNELSKVINKKSFILRGNNKLIDNVINIIVKNLKYKLLVIDMKDYTSSTSVSRLIGSDPGYVGYKEFNILDKIKYQPFTLIYLKNYEYAHQSIVSLFSSIIENQCYHDKRNNIINFNNTLIIMGDNSENLSIGFNDTCKENEYSVVNLHEKMQVMI